MIDTFGFRLLGRGERKKAGEAKSCEFSYKKDFRIYNSGIVATSVSCCNL